MRAVAIIKVYRESGSVYAKEWQWETERNAARTGALWSKVETRLTVIEPL